MLDAIEPRQFDEWIAYDRIEPDPDKRLREILKRGFAALVTGWGGKTEPDNFDPPAAQEVPTVGPAGARQLLGGLIRSH